MTINGARHLPLALLIALLTSSVWTSGCVKRRVQAAPPVIVATPTEQPAPSTPQPETKRSAPPETSPPAPVLVVPPPKAPPARRGTRTEPPANPAPEQPPTVPAAPPQISPRLSAQEQAEAERRTSEDISQAERNLLLAPENKQLSVVQRDLVEKIRGFLAQAREAIRAADWVRARTLAQKARVLSNELVNSL